MKLVARPEIQGDLVAIEKTCVYCGARFRVLVTQPADPLRSWRHEFDCPGCGKHYQVRSGSVPEVRLLGGRTDGKDDRYQETMF